MKSQQYHQHNKQYEIEFIFPLPSQASFMVHLKTDKWEKPGNNLVTLVCEEGSIVLQYLACGVNKDQIVIKIKPDTEDEQEIAKIFNLLGKDAKPKYILFDDDQLT